MNIPHNKKNQNGFTLVELLIAMVILTTGLLAAAAMQSTAITSNSFANRHSIITEIAQMVMDDIQSADLRGNFQAGVPNNTLINQITQLVPLNGSTAFNYDRFPPFGQANNNAFTNYTVPNVGTFQARYTITRGLPNLGAKIVQIVVNVRMQNRLNPAVWDDVPFCFVGYRSLP